MSILSMNFTIAQDLITRQNQDGTVVIMKMDDSNTFFKVDGIAAHIWTSMQSNQELEDVFNEIHQEYNVSEEQLLKDMSNFITTLKEKELIQV